MKFKWKGLEKNNFAEGEIEAEEKEDAQIQDEPEIQKAEGRKKW